MKMLGLFVMVLLCLLIVAPPVSAADFRTIVVDNGFGPEVVVVPTNRSLLGLGGCLFNNLNGLNGLGALGGYGFNGAIGGRSLFFGGPATIAARHERVVLRSGVGLRNRLLLR